MPSHEITANMIFSNSNIYYDGELIGKNGQSNISLQNYFIEGNTYGYMFNGATGSNLPIIENSNKDRQYNTFKARQPDDGYNGKMNIYGGFSSPIYTGTGTLLDIKSYNDVDDNDNHIDIEEMNKLYNLWEKSLGPTFNAACGQIFMDPTFEKIQAAYIHKEIYKSLNDQVKYSDFIDSFKNKDMYVDTALFDCYYNNNDLIDDLYKKIPDTDKNLFTSEYKNDLFPNTDHSGKLQTGVEKISSLIKDWKSKETVPKFSLSYQIPFTTMSDVNYSKDGINPVISEDWSGTLSNNNYSASGLFWDHTQSGIMNSGIGLDDNNNLHDFYDKFGSTNNDKRNSWVYFYPPLYKKILIGDNVDINDNYHNSNIESIDYIDDNAQNPPPIKIDVESNTINTKNLTSNNLTVQSGGGLSSENTKVEFDMVDTKIKGHNEKIILHAIPHHSNGKPFIRIGSNDVNVELSGNITFKTSPTYQESHGINVTSATTF